VTIPTPTDTDAVAVVHSFNEAINDRDLAALGRFMTTTHRFIDSEGNTVSGRNACIDAWRGFFETFPDYRNVFEDVSDAGDGVVVVHGCSECSFPPLDGPAEWRVLILDGLVDVWQVSEPGVTPPRGQA
jgi:ketosteroid isomerase-like protein